MPDTAQDLPQALTASERLPASPWQGFWLLKSAPGSREWLDLLLLFRDGLVIGKGQDRYGEFFVRGWYDPQTGEMSLDNNCALNESICRGSAGLDRGIWGLWRWLPDGVGWQIWPQGVADPAVDLPFHVGLAE